MHIVPCLLKQPVLIAAMKSGGMTESVLKTPPVRTH